MLATRQVEALEAAVAAEVAASILDVATGRNRAPALAVRHRYAYYKERELSQRRHLRACANGHPPFGGSGMRSGSYIIGAKGRRRLLYISRNIGGIGRIGGGRTGDGGLRRGRGIRRCHRRRAFSGSGDRC